MSNNFDSGFIVSTISHSFLKDRMVKNTAKDGSMPDSYRKKGIMNKQDFLNLYSTLKDNSDNMAEMIREKSKDAFAEIQDQSIMKGFKAGYEAAAGDIIEKLKDINLAESFPEVDFEEIKASAIEGMHDFGEFMENAEASVLAKMAELKEIELSEKQKKIAIMVAASLVGLTVSSVVLVKRYKKKKARRIAAEEELLEQAKAEIEKAEEVAYDEIKEAEEAVEAAEEVEEASEAVEAVEEVVEGAAEAVEAAEEGEAAAGAEEAADAVGEADAAEEGEAAAEAEEVAEAVDEAGEAAD